MSGLAGRLRAGWAGVTGTGAAASIALALLVFACTFIAAYLPRASLTSRTAALQQTLSAGGQLSRSVTASALAAQSGTNDVTSIGGFWPVLARDLGAGGLRPAPRAAGWAGFTTLPIQLAGSPGQVELAYRSTLAGNARLVAGTMPATVVTVHHHLHTFQVAVTQATAAALHIGVGSALTCRGGALLVTGVLRPDHPAAAFWAYDPLLLSFDSLAETGGAFIGAGEVGALEGRHRRLALVELPAATRTRDRQPGAGLPGPAGAGRAQRVQRAEPRQPAERHPGRVHHHRRRHRRGAGPAVRQPHRARPDRRTAGRPAAERAPGGRVRDHAGARRLAAPAVLAGAARRVGRGRPGGRGRAGRRGGGPAGSRYRDWNGGWRCSFSRWRWAARR